MSIKHPFPILDGLISRGEFCFQAWDDRYSKGVWAAIGPYEAAIDVIRDSSSDGDLDMIPAMEYAFSAEWLPWVTAPSLLIAMGMLEEKLAALPPEQLIGGSIWRSAVVDVIDNLSRTKHQCKGYGALNGKLTSLPASYEAYAASITDSPDH